MDFRKAWKISAKNHWKNNYAFETMQKLNLKMFRYGEFY